MQYANSLDGLKILAEPEVQGATCPSCGANVRAKCGNHNVWHWAHIDTEDCDTWSEPEGEWHLGWKEVFPQDWREVVIGEHRADIRTTGGLVVELQHSSITPEVVAERENFYGNMIWIFDATDYVERCGVVCWFGEHPHPKFPNGRDTLVLCLNNLEKLLKERERFFASNEMPEELVDISEAPPRHNDISYREYDIKKKKDFIHHAKDKIAEWQEKLDLEPSNQKASRLLKDWQSKKNNAEANLKSREEIGFLLKPFPVMEKSPENVQIFDLSVPSWRIKFRWLKPRTGNLACKKPVFWDVGSQKYLVFFPDGTVERDHHNVSSALVLEKMVILDAITKAKV
jgi:ssDNA-binding Zn-finger/Zn-ribbon topoisomerase 1